MAAPQLVGIVSISKRAFLAIYGRVFGRFQVCIRVNEVGRDEAF